MTKAQGSVRSTVLNIRSVRHLCHRLGATEHELKRICNDLEKDYRSRKIYKNGKHRQIDAPVGRLRQLLHNLNRILQNLLFPHNMHGGLRGRSTFTYASGHVGKPVLVKSDLKNFFPSISSGRVYEMFVNRLGCSPDVAHYLTRLTTYKGFVPQGSPTSTVIGALVTIKLAGRLDGLAKALGGKSDIFVDDIVLSGPGYAGRLKGTVKNIIQQEGFQPNDAKTEELDAKTEQVLTGIRVNSILDVPSEKIEVVREIIRDLKNRKFGSRYISESELASVRGRIRYIIKLNRGTGLFLKRKLQASLRSTDLKK